MTLQKMIYFILAEGWKTFINRSKINMKDYKEEFSSDIFRDI